MKVVTINGSMEFKNFGNINFPGGYFTTFSDGFHFVGNKNQKQKSKTNQKQELNKKLKTKN